MPTPSHEVLSRAPFQGRTRYSVRLVAENGYTEVQEYVGDEAMLTSAQAHFNASVMAQAQALEDILP